MANIDIIGQALRAKMPSPGRNGLFQVAAFVAVGVTTLQSADISTGRVKRPDTAFEQYLLEHETAFISQILSKMRSGIRLLDVCCGTGSATQRFRNHGIRIIGLDINPAAVTVFTQEPRHAQAILGNTLNLPFADSSFDLVVGIHCFEQVDKIQFLKDCNRVLRPEGLLIFDAINRNGYKSALKRLSRFQSRRRRTGSDRWIDTFGYDQVVHAATDCGFIIRAIRGYSWPPLTKQSDSKLIGMMAAIEQALQLGRYYKSSPRLLVAAGKSVIVERASKGGRR